MLEFMRLAGDGPVDSMRVPMYQWDTIVKFVSRSSVELRSGGLVLAETRMWDICWYVYRTDFDRNTIGWKIVTWEHSLAQYERNFLLDSKQMKWASILKARFRPIKLLWNAYHWYFHLNEHCFNVFRSLLESNTQRVESWAERESTLKDAESPFFNLILMADVLPRIFYYIWYSRDKDVCRRLVSAIRPFKSFIPYWDDVVGYLEVLSNTDFPNFTEFEVGYFGADLPYLLKWWHALRIADQLATSGFAETMRRRGSSLTVVSWQG